MEDQWTSAINFVISRDHVPRVRQELERVGTLFQVKVTLGKVDRDKQWLRVLGVEQDASRAKEYLLALVSPEMTVAVENIQDHPGFTPMRHVNMERMSGAVLTRFGLNGITIKGSNLTVALALSMIDEMVSGRVSTIFEGPGSSEEQMPVEGGDKDDEDLEDCYVIDEEETQLAGVPNMTQPCAKEVKSSFNSQRGTAETVADAGGGVGDTGRKQKPVGVVSPLSPHGREQQAYLYKLALELQYDVASVEEAFARFDMNDIIRPASFMEAVAEVARSRLAGGAVNSGSSQPVGSLEARGRAEVTGRSRSKYVDPDASVVCMDSSDDEETEVLRPVGQSFPGAGVHALDCSTIVLSSDDEQENPRPQLSRANTQKPSLPKASTKVFTSEVAAQSQLPRTQQSQTRGQPLQGNPPFTGGVPLLPRAENLPEGSRVVPAPAPGSVTDSRAGLTSRRPGSPRDHALPVAPAAVITPSGGEEPVGPTEAQLRQEYVDSLMRASHEPRQPKRGLRYIVIDGSNVAFCHGNSSQFSVPGIEICIKFFLARGHTNITAFVPEWRRYTNQVSASGRALLDRLNKAGFVKFTPARRVGNRTIASYDDRFILNLAVEEEGVIVSNDQYRDLQGERPGYHDAVTNRLLQYTFVNNHFMPPDDPLGRFGPGLDHFLRYPDQRQPPAVSAGRGASAAVNTGCVASTAGTTAPPSDKYDRFLFHAPGQGSVRPPSLGYGMLGAGALR